MFRTRDFILFFVIIVFLSMAIGATLISRSSHNDSEVINLPGLVEVDDRDFSAEIPSVEVLSREERLASMRQKIANKNDLVISAATTEAESVVDEFDEDVEVAEAGSVEVSLCQNYQPFVGFWPGGAVQTEVVEGVRLFYTETESVAVKPDNGATTTDISTQNSRLVRLELPTAPLVTGTENCVPSDVVAVSGQGSLIRNNEVGLYSLFGGDTLIGYALDGWPVYGVTERELDECGGALVGGEYRYYLDAEAEFILNCFVSLPTNL